MMHSASRMVVSISQGICNWRENSSCGRIELYIRGRLQIGEWELALSLIPLSFHLYWSDALCKSHQLTDFLIVFLLTHQFLSWHPLYWHMSPLLRANHVSFRIMNVSLWHKQINMFNKLLIVMQFPSFPWPHLWICNVVHWRWWGGSRVLLHNFYRCWMVLK